MQNRPLIYQRFHDAPIEAGDRVDQLPMLGGELIEFTRSQVKVYGPELAAPWNGQGLPPVGTRCEVLWSAATGGYWLAQVIGHDHGHAVVRYLTGERKGEYGQARPGRCCAGLPYIRPERTAEQIARDEAVDKLVERFALYDRPNVDWPALFGQMYDAGVIK